MKAEYIVLNKERNVSLTAYLLDVGGEFRYINKRPAVFVIPGGGYQFCSDREADPVAMAFLQAGYDAFVLHYSVGKNAKWPTPLKDYEAAMQYILDRADEWHIYRDKIAVIGFSAGGHLAAACATMAEHRPAAAILGYPVIREDTTHECEQTAPGIVSHVDGKTCPCFLFASRTDDVVPIQNTIDMINALNAYQISFECHIYAYGPHGFSTADSSVQPAHTKMPARIADWVKDSICWLKDVMGDYTEDGLGTPACKAKVTGDADAWLSLDCTIGRLLGNPEALRILKPLIVEMRGKIKPFAPGMTFEDMMQVLSKMTLRNLLIERQIGVDMLDEIEEKLKAVPNI